MPSLDASALSPDPELRQLPPAPQATRRLTLAVLAMTALASAALAVALLPDARYGLQQGTPHDLGNLSALPDATALEPLNDHWVRGSGALVSGGARYQRPLDGDSYRLSPVEGAPQLWVQVRVPEGDLARHFVPPGSFVGRLMPLNAAGLRYGALADVVESLDADSAGAWVIVDGEAPTTTRWALALVALFTGFAAFCVFGLVHLTRSVARRR